MRNMKLFALVAVIILAGAAFLFYKKYSKPSPQKQSSGAENKKLISNLSNNMKITSPAFENNGNIPPEYTCDGEEASPPLEISEVPEGAKSLVLIVDDPDASLTGGFVHWIVFNISPETTEINEGAAPEGAKEGMTSSGGTAYVGPCPPSGIHHYQFKLYALDDMPKLESPAKREDVEKAMEGHVLDQATLVGLYGRQ